MKKLLSWMLKRFLFRVSGVLIFIGFFCVTSFAKTAGNISKDSFDKGVASGKIQIAEMIVTGKGSGDNLLEEKTKTETKEVSQDTDSELWQEIKGGFSYTFKNLLYGSLNKPSDSTQNPNNDFLNIPRYTLNLDLRPDFSLNFRKLFLVAKPRLALSWGRWESGAHSGETDTDDDWYVNEWLAGLNLVDGLFISYGRENLQWGPSRLVSPSNPFFPYNGQSNPIVEEVPGMEFARLVWVSNTSWTASLIANLGQGLMDFPYGFERTYALKVDYTGNKKYGSLIGSYQEENRGTLGGYGGWWFSDAILLYAEGSLSKGTNALYPEYNPASPFGIEMVDSKDENSSPEGLLTVGASYTFESGATFTLEYFFNSPGYNDGDAELYDELRASAADAFYLPPPWSSYSNMALTQTLFPRLRFLRKNYLTIQFYQVEIQDVLDIILRYTYNVDDSSSVLIPIVSYDIGDYFQVFLTGDQRFGSKDSEFRSIIDYSYMLGVEFIF